MRRGYRILAHAFHFVVPAKAGTHFRNASGADRWVPAFAGTTTGLEQAAEVRRA